MDLIKNAATLAQHAHGLQRLQTSPPGSHAEGDVNLSCGMKDKIVEHLHPFLSGWTSVAASTRCWGEWFCPIFIVSAFLHEVGHKNSVSLLLTSNIRKDTKLFDVQQQRRKKSCNNRGCVRECVGHHHLPALPSLITSCQDDRSHPKSVEGDVMSATRGEEGEEGGE